MAKHWTTLTRDAEHVVQKMRHLFIEEHKTADMLMFSKEGVPLQAVYFSPEMPGYGEIRKDAIAPPLPPMKEVK